MNVPTTTELIDPFSDGVGWDPKAQDGGAAPDADVMMTSRPTLVFDSEERELD